MVRQSKITCLALLLLGCKSPSPQNTAAEEPETTVVNRTWRLAGRTSNQSTESEVALPFSGAEEILSRCENTDLCAAELWRSTDGAEHILLRTDNAVWWSEIHDRWPTKWNRLSGVLEHCLGDPLDSPPGGDPGGWRQLVTEGTGTSVTKAQWLIHLSGENRCQIYGTLELDATGPTINARALRCGESPWLQGGRECARTTLQGPTDESNE